MTTQSAHLINSSINHPLFNLSIHKPTTLQSLNQSIHQPTILQSINPSINQSCFNQSIHPSTNHASINQSIHQPIMLQSINPSINQSCFNQSIHPSTNHASINQSIHQPIMLQSINPSILQFFHLIIPQLDGSSSSTKERFIRHRMSNERCLVRIFHQPLAILVGSESDEMDGQPSRHATGEEFKDVNKHKA